MAEPIVVEDLMRILTSAADAVRDGDEYAFKVCTWEMEAIERPTDAHGWDTTKMALYTMHLLDGILHPPMGLKSFAEAHREVLDDMRERAAYFAEKRRRAEENGADFF